ncbi:MAG: VanW family protein [Berkelbacteria bacterium GW2011_GWA2_35_9]|uniref:VanW family protein n=1 Tax=Berkelbacteria bacterium GW2011_GWA2_35_9 TaxID=1618333 RepID=A0A0G0D5Y2_9BACT|nr:MAG: VanW family protein [Berkelbacteria bacterium GW2011_GWA2_35_9]
MTKISITKKIKVVLQKTLVVVLWLIAIIFFILGIFNLVYANKVLPNIYFGSKSLGGLDKEHLGYEIETQIKLLSLEEITISIAEKNISLKPFDIDFTLNKKNFVDEIYRYGKRDNIFETLRDQLQLIAKSQRFPKRSYYNQEKLNQFIENNFSEFQIESQNATFSYQKGKLEKVAEITGRTIDKNLLIEKIEKQLISRKRTPIKIDVQVQEPKVYLDGLIEAEKEVENYISANLEIKSSQENVVIPKEQIFNWLHFYASRTQVINGQGYVLSVGLSTENIISDLTAVAKKINQEPINAKLAISNGKATIFQPAQDGLVLDKEKTTESIVSALSKSSDRKVEMTIRVEKAEIRDDNIDNLGIKELIGTAETSYKNSPNNRVSNLTTGTKYLNGALIKPGESFSTIKALGSISIENGYLPELVIKDNRTIPEIGGGLCQVSTTLFRAVLNAGLPVTERANHSFRVSYYEPPVGLDATIYSPKPDLVFKNDTTSWILIQGSTDPEKKTIKFELFGTKDGRKSQVDGPYVSNYINPPDPINEDDPNLNEGTTKQVEKPHQGASAVAYYKVFNQDGSIRTEQTFKSKYKALPAVYKVGKRPVSTPTQ